MYCISSINSMKIISKQSLEEIIEQDRLSREWTRKFIKEKKVNEIK